jgi:acetoin utilization deacetylase AcuC-like enzyme
MGFARVRARWHSEFMMARTAVVYGAGYECDIGPHVFPMEKFRLVRDALIAAGDLDPAEILDPAPAPREDLLLAHTAEYLDDLEQLRWTPRTLASELPLTADIVRAYKLAAGGTVLAATEALARGCGINIGGGFHHAFADRAEGFCYLNDLAVAVRVLQRNHRVARAAIVDLDVHQGNGTAAIFAGDPGVFTLSLHQELNYPVPKQRSTLDVGLPDGIDDTAYLRALDPALERVWAFDPGIVLYQAGADPYRNDMLGGLGLTIEGLEMRDHRVLGGCRARGIPSVVTLGGGYAREREDTVTIQAATCRMALTRAAIPTTPGAE